MPNVKKGPLSYTGCWTCRRRRVKCDESSPTCNACQDARIACDGYAVRLVWDADESIEKQRPRGRRRRIEPEQNVMELKTHAELSLMLSNVDESASRRANVNIGPFSVFEGVSSTREADSSPRSSGRVIEEISDESQDQCSREGDGISPDPAATSSSIDTAARSVDGSHSPEPPPANKKHGTSSAHSSLDHEDSINTDSDSSSQTVNAEDWTSSDVVLTSSGDITAPFVQDLVPYSQQSSSTHRHLPHIVNFMPALTPSRSTNGTSTANMLMHHYAEYMVNLMQPILHQASPFRQIYLPLAIAGSGSIQDAGHNDDSQSPTTAVCHNLLSLAANNLRSLGSGLPGLQELAFQHKQRALVALRSSLASPSNKYRELMVAILSLVSVDLLSGGVTDHWIHLEAARQLQTSRHFRGVISHETRQLDSMCTMLRLFSQSTLYDPEPQTWPGNGISFKESDAAALSPSIEHLYGITRHTAGTILKTYRLTQMLAQYRKTSEEPPPELLQACEDLSDELATWFISPETFAAIGHENEQMLAIALAQEKAFHAAALIYYCRSVQLCPREDLITEQRAVLAAMHEAEDIKALLGSAISSPAPISWPAFLSSCEAVGEMRQHWSEWWERIRPYQMMSYAQQFNAVSRVWATLDQAHDTMDWREALKAAGIRILPV